MFAVPSVLIFHASCLFVSHKSTSVNAAAWIVVSGFILSKASSTFFLSDMSSRTGFPYGGGCW